jgi:hypothetical protein
MLLLLASILINAFKRITCNFMPLFCSRGFGGLVVRMLLQTRPKPSGFFGRKNSQHAFLRKGSKAVCPMSQICGMLKNPVITRKLGHGQNQSAISRPIGPPFATRSARVDVDVGASGGEGENVYRQGKATATYP